MANSTVILNTPIEGHEGQVKHIVLRPPKYADIMMLGEPAAFARSDGGMVYQAEKENVIQGYIERLLIEPKDPLLLIQLDLIDTLQLKDAVHDFFAAARQATSAK